MWIFVMKLHEISSQSFAETLRESFYWNFGTLPTPVLMKWVSEWSEVKWSEWVKWSEVKWSEWSEVSEEFFCPRFCWNSAHLKIKINKFSQFSLFLILLKNFGKKSDSSLKIGKNFTKDFLVNFFSRGILCKMNPN